MHGMWVPFFRKGFLCRVPLVDALDIDLIEKTLQDVLNGRKAEVPVYDYVSNSRKKGEFYTIYPADVVLFEGILAFYFPQVRDLFHMKLFVDTDPDTRLSRRGRCYYLAGLVYTDGLKCIFVITGACTYHWCVCFFSYSWRPWKRKRSGNCVESVYAFR